MCKEKHVTHLWSELSRHFFSHHIASVRLKLGWPTLGAGQRNLTHFRSRSVTGWGPNPRPHLWPDPFATSSDVESYHFSGQLWWQLQPRLWATYQFLEKNTQHIFFLHISVLFFPSIFSFPTIENHKRNKFFSSYSFQFFFSSFEHYPPLSNCTCGSL